ncbi:MAG TPA: hypothetical protein VM840_01375 [Actinomycetota bacterium]|nr:hypothetical protein [Actinomycetota bacterium]
MSVRGRVGVVAGLGAVLFVVSMVGGAVNAGGPPHGSTAAWNGWGEVATWSAYMVVALLVGLLVMVRHPGNATGPVAAAGGVAGLLALAADQWAGYALVVAPGAVPGGLAARLVSHLAFVGCWGLLAVVLPAVFPTGRLLSRRWAVPIWVGVAGCFAFGLLVLQSDAFTDDGLLGNLPGMRNPLAPPSIRGLVAALTGFGIFAIFGGMLASVASLLMRATRGSSRERAQVRVVAFAAALAAFGGIALANLMNALDPGSLPHGIVSASSAALGLVVPASLGVAILRRRVYDIDRLISRTVLYALLSSGLAGAYALVVFSVTAIVGVGGSESDLGVAVGTLVVAALFRPVRARLQSFVDRRFNRSRYDAARTIESFGARLREDADVEVVRAALLDTVTRTMQPAIASLWLPAPDAERHGRASAIAPGTGTGGADR